MVTSHFNEKYQIYNRIEYNTIKVFKAPSKFAEHSSETEMPTTTHRWLGKNLGK